MRGLHWLVVGVVACGPAQREPSNTDGDASVGDDAQKGCATGIRGKVFAPNGTLPLYGVQVYVPASDPPPFASGVQCGRCEPELPGGSIARATSDVDGSFQLDLDPAIAGDVPLIVTTGKWRRKLTVHVDGCAMTNVADGIVRLPKNRSEGELPRIAQVTGGCDGLACVLSKIGIDASEFGSSASGSQAVTFYAGVGGNSPGAPQPAAALWGSLDELKKFDLVINACECGEHRENKTAPDVLQQYADLGGRVYGSHYHYTWMRDLVPAWHGVASWVDSSYVAPGPVAVDTTMPAGDALARWLMAVGASSNYGQVTLGQTIPNAGAVVAPTTRWLYSGETTHYLSFQTPVGAEPTTQCGKVVYAGLHVSSGSVTASFPQGCTSTAFTPDEKALVYLLFDLQACNAIIF